MSDLSGDLAWGPLRISRLAFTERDQSKLWMVRQAARELQLGGQRAVPSVLSRGHHATVHGACFTRARWSVSTMRTLAGARAWRTDRSYTDGYWAAGSRLAHGDLTDRSVSGHAWHSVSWATREFLNIVLDSLRDNYDHPR